MVLERNREDTENRILDAVGHIVASEGFEKVGVNAVAAEAGIAKMLIYRYFTSIDGLLAAYIRRNDYWLNIPLDVPVDSDALVPYVIEIYKSQIERLRENIVMRRLLRWELSHNGPLIENIRKKREKNGMALITAISQISGKPMKEISVMASLLSASITYLALLGDCCPVYNGLDIGNDADWSSVYLGIEKIIQQYLE